MAKLGGCIEKSVIRKKRGPLEEAPTTMLKSHGNQIDIWIVFRESRLAGSESQKSANLLQKIQNYSAAVDHVHLNFDIYVFGPVQIKNLHDLG